MRLIRRFSLTDQQRPDPDLPPGFDPKQVFLEGDAVRRPTKKPQAQDLFQDAWKNMNETAKGAKQEENQPRATTYYKVAQALRQRESTRKSKPVAVIHTKPQRYQTDIVVIPIEPKKESVATKKKSKKHRKSKSKVSKVKPEQVEYPMMFEGPAVAENALNTVKIKDESTSMLPPVTKCLEKSTTPLPKEKTTKDSPGQSERTAESTQASTKALHLNTLIIVDECSKSVCSELTCLDSLCSDWSGANNEEGDEEEIECEEDKQCADDDRVGFKLNVKDETSVTEDDEDEADSWANEIVPIVEFVQTDSIKDRQSVSSSTIVPHVRDDDSSLPTDRESDVDTLSRSKDESSVFVSSDESDSRRFPVFLRGDSENSSCFEGQKSYPECRLPKARNMSNKFRNPSQQAGKD